MKKKGLTSLTMDTAEVSLVDRGANKKSRFPVTKQEDLTVTPQEEILKAVLETEVDAESKLDEVFEKAEMSDKAKAAVKGTLRMLAGYKDELPKDVLDKLAGLAGYPAPKMKQDAQYPKPKEDEMKKEDVKKNENPEFEAVLKEQKDQIAALTEANDKVTKALNDEREKRSLDEWTAKAEKELSHYPGKSAAELGSMLQKMHATDPEFAKSQFTSMKAASDALKQASIFKEAGGSGGGESMGGSWEKIESLALGLVQKSADPNMTREKAIALVLKRQPELYDNYLDEHPAQRAADRS